MRRAVLTTALLLAGCYPTTAPWETAEKLNRQYAGRPANEFFFHYGYPLEETDLTVGKSYRWVRAGCEVRVDVDHQDVIEAFSVTVDRMGRFTESRCSEIFSTPGVF